MPRAIPSRRVPRHHLMIHRQPPRRGRSPGGAHAPPARLSDLILGLVAVLLLGGLALMAAYALTHGTAAP